MLRHVDLCSGIGGFSLGFEWAGLSKPILFCDTEPWCRKILAKNFPDVPIATDVKELANDPERNVPDCDILTAGYPCQPFSVAGKQKGTEDDRHIWPYILRIVAHKRPTWCVFENVHGHVALGLDQVLLDLEAEGYSTRTFIVPACGVNAPHRRDRLWIVAYSDSERLQGCKETRDIESSGQRCQKQSTRRSEIWPMAHTKSEQSTPDDNGGEQGAVSEPQQVQPRGSSSWGGRGCNWSVEPNIRRVAHGIPRRVDRLKGLGNAIVPQIAMNIGLAIKEQIK